MQHQPLGRRIALAALAVALAVPVQAADSKATPLGGKVANSRSLRDLRGNRRVLHDFKGHKAVVLAFLGTECPLANLYTPSLLRLEKAYRGRGVQFLAVYPNESEDLDRVATHAYDRDVPFPVLKDNDRKLADALGVERTPTVVILDSAWVLRYRGRIDDRYGPSYRRQQATRDDLREALEDVLAGRAVRVAETEADGCLLDRGSAKARPGVTYAKQVARILQRRCQACHRPGQSAPFSLLTYDDAARHGRMIREVTTQRRMPPWHADPRHGRFANERRLTDAEVATLAAWVDAGLPRGDDADLPPPVRRPTGWTLGEPDVVFTMPEEFEVPAEGSLPYKSYTIETNFTEDRWVQMAEARPGAAAVVHHVVAYILAPGQRSPFTADGGLSVLVGWAPGDLPLVCPPDTALRIPRGSRLRLELHYTPNGKATRDRSSIGITFAKKPPQRELFTNAFTNESIRVPAHDPHYRAEATFRLPAAARLIGFVPHMHWRGKHYHYEAIYPGGRRETLLSVPRWDFNWQSVYRFAEPLRLPKGTKIHAVAHWDNSINNPYNPDPGKDVRFGLQTWDEMMVGWVSYVWERPETAQELARRAADPADRMFDRFDRNGDDVISAEEIPERMRAVLKASGVTLPSSLTREAFHEVYAEMRKRFGQRPKSGAAPKRVEEPRP